MAALFARRLRSRRKNEPRWWRPQIGGKHCRVDGGEKRIPWADLPPKAMSPFAVETRSPGRNVGSFFTPSGARPKGSLPLQLQFPTRPAFSKFESYQAALSSL